MAELAPEPYPTPDWDDYDDMNKLFEREQEIIEELRDDPDETLVRFGIADGYAIYRVKSWDPLTLQHVPTGDAYAISAAHMRGLREEEVKRARSDRNTLV